MSLQPSALRVPGGTFCSVDFNSSLRPSGFNEPFSAWSSTQRIPFAVLARNPRCEQGNDLSSQQDQNGLAQNEKRAPKKFPASWSALGPNAPTTGLASGIDHPRT